MMWNLIIVVVASFSMSCAIISGLETFLRPVEQFSEWDSIQTKSAPVIDGFSTGLDLRDMNDDGQVDFLASGHLTNCDSSVLNYRLLVFKRNGNLFEDHTDSVITPPYFSVGYSQFVNRPSDALLNIISVSLTQSVIVFRQTENATFEISSLVPVNNFSFTLSSLPYVRLFVADFHLGDGLEDVLLTGFYSNAAYVQLSNGTFVDKVQSLFPQNYSTILGNQDALSFGDFNGDGHPDIFVCGQDLFREYGAILVQQSNGTFSSLSPLPFLVRSNPAGAFGDLDGDSFSDLVIQGRLFFNYSYSLSIYKNNRNGTFTDQWSSLPPNATKLEGGTVAVMDVDRDGKNDIYISGSDSGTIKESYILLNRGNGVFSKAFSRGGFVAHRITWNSKFFADSFGFVEAGTQTLGGPTVYSTFYNNEFGYSDINMFSENTFIVSLENSNGNLVDINGDGCNDFVTSGLYRSSHGFLVPKGGLFYGHCNGSFSDSLIKLPYLFGGFSIWYDFDKDGSVENLAVDSIHFDYLEFENNVTINVFNRSSAFERVGIQSEFCLDCRVFVVDLDQDSWMDLLWFGTSVTKPMASVFRNQGNQSFVDFKDAFLPPFFPLTDGGVGLMIDAGEAFFLAGKNNGSVFGSYFWTRSDNGSYTLADVQMIFSGNPIHMPYGCVATLVDLNWDGEDDIFLVGASNCSRVYIRRSNFTFQPVPLDIDLDLFSGSMISPFDIDHDGHFEILFAPTNIFLTLYRSLGNGSVTDVSSLLPPIGGFWKGQIVVGQIDTEYDQYPDLVITGSTTEHCGHAVLITSQRVLEPGSSNVSTTSGSTLPEGGTVGAGDSALAAILGGALGGAGLLGVLLAACFLCLVCCCIGLVCLVIAAAAVVVAIGLLVLLVGGTGLAAFVGVDVALFLRIRGKPADLPSYADLQDATDHSPQELLEMAQSVGDFEVLRWSDIKLVRKLGEGAYGEVFSASWQGVDVAVKMFKHAGVTAQEDFHHEAVMMTKVSHHPHMVQFIGAAFRDDDIAMVMCLCEGGSLLSALQNGRLDCAAKSRVLREVASAVAFLHKLDIVHRDISARNVLLDGGGKAKLADLGMSRVLENSVTEQNTASTVGPVRWMAPEAMRQRVYSPASDCYSFSILMYEVWSDGAVPYGHIASLADVALQVLGNELRPSIPASMPADQERLMRRLWHSDPKARPSMTEALSVFDGFLRSESNYAPIHSSPSSTVHTYSSL